MSRHRVSFEDAWAKAKGTADDANPMEFLVLALKALWWWIAGVPTGHGQP